MKNSKHKSRRGLSPLARRAIAAAATGALAWGALTSHAQGPAGKMTYDSFKLVQTRNIFDPDRSRDYVPPSQRTKEVRTYTTPPPAVAVQKVDYVELTGVMVTEGETYAFFAGSEPEYNKVVAVNGAIAGATVTKITSAGIEVSRNGKEATVTVGQTVPLDENSGPGLPPSGSSTTAAVAATPASPAVDPKTASEDVPLPETTGTPSTTSPPPADNNISDAMRRMIERRQKELNQ